MMVMSAKHCNCIITTTIVTHSGLKSIPTTLSSVSNEERKVTPNLLMLPNDSEADYVIANFQLLY